MTLVILCAGQPPAALGLDVVERRAVAALMLVIGGWGPDFAPSGTAILSPVHLMIVPGARLRLRM